MAASQDLKFGVAGAAGRMGRALLAEIAGAEGAALVAATEAPASPELGRDAGELAGLGPLGVALGDDPRAMFAAADAVLDFTTPQATRAHAELAAENGKILIAGTTGLGPDETAALGAFGARAVIVWAANMSLGVNLLLGLTEQVARTLDQDFDIEIVEMHHRHKLDAPSGTALALGRAAAQGRGVSLDEVALRGRDGRTGARPRGAIGFAALRGGDVVGDHTVVFAGTGERIELSHRAAHRRIYAAGALHAAFWARDKAPGLYSMKDVLGLA